MAEYIDRESMKQALRNAHIYLNGEDETVIEIEDIPAADVQPVVHGRWVRDAVYIDETTGDPCLAWFCNQCGEPQMVGTNYCPHCGAKMDGET